MPRETLDPRRPVTVHDTRRVLLAFSDGPSRGREPSCTEVGVTAVALRSDPTLDAMVVAAGLWVGAYLADADLRDCMLHALELGVVPSAVNASAWLVAAADQLPRVLTVRLICQCLSESESLAGPSN